MIRIWNFPRQDVALLLLRVFIGIAFVFHGLGKANDLSTFAIEFNLSPWLAAVATYTQIFAGVLLIVGFVPPLPALGLASTMAVATLQLIGRGEPFVSPHGHSWEASAFYLVSTIALALLGPGKYSLHGILVPLSITRHIKGRTA